MFSLDLWASSEQIYQTRGTLPNNDKNEVPWLTKVSWNNSEKWSDAVFKTFKWSRKNVGP